MLIKMFLKTGVKIPRNFFPQTLKGCKGEEITQVKKVFVHKMKIMLLNVIKIHLESTIIPLLVNWELEHLPGCSQAESLECNIGFHILIRNL
jgi:hypothetical protein